MSLVDLIKRFRGYWAAVVVATVLAFVGAILEAISLVLLVALANSVTSDDTTIDEAIGPLDISIDTDVALVLIPAAVIASVALLIFGNYLRSRATSRWTFSQRKEIVSVFTKADWSKQQADRAGELQTLSSWAAAGGTALGGVGTMGRSAVSILVLLGTAVVVNIGAAVAILVVGTFLALGLRPLVRRVRWWSRRMSALAREQNAELGAMSEMATEIRIYGSGEAFDQRLGEQFEKIRVAEIRLGTIQSSTSPIYQGTALLLLVVALAIASQTSNLGIGELGVVTLLVIRSISYGQQLQTAYNGVVAAVPGLELLDEALSKLSIHETVSGKGTTPVVDRLQLENVSFSYEPGAPAVNDLSCELRTGEIVGLVGPSGSGKSTLAHLILRLREPSSGRISVNGVPTRELGLDSWYLQFAFVPQEPLVFHGTAFDNIAFFRPEIDQARVETAARAAGIHDVISALSDGYSTELGRAARNLSGGQIQRIGIARALAGNPSVIVLDEPTSALDQESELIVHEALDKLSNSALVVLITHQETSIKLCDHVLVLRDGSLVSDRKAATISPPG